jgi:hypothetical protein
MKTVAEIENGMAYMTGTSEYTRWSPLFRNHVLTDGAKFIAESADAYWLMDAIASYHAKCMKDEMLCDFQSWKLKVNAPTPKDIGAAGEVLTRSATLTCERDTDDVAFTQEIPYTDFPLEEIKFYCNPMGDGTHMVILLPSEY